MVVVVCVCEKRWVCVCGGGETVVCVEGDAVVCVKTDAILVYVWKMCVYVDAMVVCVCVWKEMRW